MTPDVYYCGRIRACAWSGKESDLVPVRDYTHSIIAHTLTCPRCGNEDFYTRKHGEKPPKGWKPKEPAASPWISVEISLPESDVTVIVHTPEEPTEPVWIGYHDGTAWFSTDNLQFIATVTHWMPFPEPPASTPHQSH